MATLVQYFKIIVLIYVLIQYIFTSVYAKSLKNSFLYMALFVMLVYDFRLLRLSVFTDPVINLFIVGIALYIHVHCKKGIEKLTASDFHETYLAEIIENVEEGIAIVNKDNLKILASNVVFVNFLNQYKDFISLHDMLSRFNRGERFIEINGFENETRFYKVSLTDIDRDRIRIHIHDVSEDKIAEKILKEKLLLQMEMVNASTNAILLFNEDMDMIQLNQKAQDFLGLSADETVSTSMIQKGNSDLYEQLNVMKKTIVNGVAVKQSELFKINGQIKYLHLQMSSLLIGTQVFYLIEMIDQTYLYRVKNRLSIMHELAIEIEGTPLLEDVYYDLIANKPYFIGVNFNQDEKSKDAYLNFIHDLTEADHLILDELKNATGDERYIGKQLGKTFPLFIYKIVRDYYNNPVGVVLRRKSDDGQSLLKLEELGRYIMPHIREGVIVADSKHNILFVNDFMLRRLSNNRENVIGNNLKYILKDTLELNFFAQKDILESSHSIHFETELIAANHTLLPIDVIALTSKGLNAEYIVLIIRDLEDKTLYQRRFIESQTKYEQVLNSIQDGVLEISLPDRKVTYIKSVTSENDCAGNVKTFYEWLEDIHVSDRALVSENIDILTSLKTKVVEFDYRIFKNGHWLWIRATGKHLQNEDHAFILLNKKNIHDLKQMESALEESNFILSEAEKITDTSYWKFDVNANEFNVSANFSSVLKLNSIPNNIPFNGFVEYIHPADRSYFKEKFLKMIWDGETLDILFRIIRHGTIRYVQIIGKSYLNGEVPDYAIGNIVDTTDKLLVEQKLQTSQRLLNTIIEQSPTGIIVVKRLGHLEIINREAIDMLSLPNQFQMTSDVLKLHMISRYRTIDGNDFRVSINKLFSEDNSVHIVKGQSGEVLKFMSSPLKDEEERYAGNIIIVVPVSRGNNL